MDRRTPSGIAILVVPPLAKIEWGLAFTASSIEYAVAASERRDLAILKKTITYSDIEKYEDGEYWE